MVAALVPPVAVWSEPSEPQPAHVISEAVYPAAGVTILLHLTSDSAQRRETGRRLGDAALASLAVASVLKETVHATRPAPYDYQHDGFPSGHTALAFAVATALSKRESGAGAVAYPVAATIAWSRHATHRHDWGQILAGAVVGVGIGHLAGEGKLRLFGHHDQDAVQAQVQAPPALLSWSTQF